METHGKPLADQPLSASSVSHRLSLIQKRCSDLLDKVDGLGLALEEPDASEDGTDPYNKQR